MNNNFNQKTMKKNGFTLAELVISIWILVILTTVSFLSYKNYSRDSRDANRLQSLQAFENGLNVYFWLNRKYPKPALSTTLSSSGTLIGYQGFLDDAIANQIKVNSSKDPLDEEFYTYSVNDTSRKYSLAWFFENKALVYDWLSVYADYKNRLVKLFWDKIGVITNSQNTPIQQLSLTTLDVTSTLDTYKAYFSNNYTLVGTWKTMDIFKVITGAIPPKSCNEILIAGMSRGDGYYVINPTTLQKRDVYCDMTTQSGGRTMIARNVVGGTGDFWWLVQRWSPQDDSQPYSFGTGVFDINFKESLLTRYSSGKTPVLQLSSSMDSNELKNYTIDPNQAVTTIRKVVYTGWLPSWEQSWNHPQMMYRWWLVAYTWGYLFRDMVPISTSYWVFPWAIRSVLYNSTYGAFENTQGMIFVR